MTIYDSLKRNPKLLNSSYSVAFCHIQFVQHINKYRLIMLLQFQCNVGRLLCILYIVKYVSSPILFSVFFKTQMRHYVVYWRLHCLYVCVHK